MKVVFLPIMEALLKGLRNDYFQYKRQLAQHRIRVVGWKTIDEYFSEVQVATEGNDLVIRYANQALKTKVEKLLLSRLARLR